MNSSASPHPSLFRQNLSAIGLCLISLTGFAMTDTASKWLTQDYPVSQVICLGNVLSVVIAAIWVIRRGGLKGFADTPNLKWHLARAFSIMCTAFLVVNAFARIPLADFYGIVFLAPLVMALLSHFLLAEKIGWHRFAAIVAGFSGVLVLAGPQFQTYNAGIIFALASVMFISCNGLIVRKMKPEKNIALFAFFPALFNMVANFPLMMMDFQPVAPADIPVFLSIGPLVVVAIITGSIAFARATETAVIAPFHYAQIIWGVAFGYLLFGDLPTLPTIAGAAIIITSGLYVLWREHRAHILHHRQNPS